MQRLGYLPALDGLRAISIALVVSSHAFGFPFGGGMIGVDVFFVLSGYLITSLLIREREATGRIDLRGFYVRRVRRLIPALLFMLVVYLAATAAFGRNELVAAAVGSSYVANLFDAAGRPLLENAHLNQLWSLAQEEQFYLLWPAVLIFLGRSRRLLQIIISAVVIVFVYRAVLTYTGASATRLYYEPDLRADGLLIGAAIAVAQTRRSLAVSEWAGQIGIAGVGVGAIIGWGFWDWPALGEPLLLATFALLLLAALSDTELARGLASRPLVWLGKRSYSLYLWHPPVIAGAVYLAGDTFDAKVGGVLAAIAIAGFSYRFVERPFRRRSIEAPTQAAEPVSDVVTASGVVG